MHLAVKLLGPFQTTLDGTAIPESRTRKIEALLAFIILEAQTAHRREQLIGLLFPELPEDQARTNFRQTLTRLRRAIQDEEADPPFLIINRESIQFNPYSDYSLDVTTFQQLSHGCPQHYPGRGYNPHCPGCRQQRQQAVQLYRGPFLSDLYLDDSAAYETWAGAYRQTLHQAALTALQELAIHHEHSGEYRIAQHYAQQLLQLEPWEEETQQQLMRLLAYQGQRNTALRQYNTYASLLRQELGIEPLPETQTLQATITAASSVRPHNLTPNSPDVVGRETELRQIYQFLADPARRLLTLFGPGGIGKTRLALLVAHHVAHQYVGPFLDGVYFIPLATLAADTPAGLERTLAETLDLALTGPEISRQLLGYLRHKHLLLILDNLEHLLPASRELVADILAQTPGVQIIVTSRERLNLSGEWVLSITGLRLPTPGRQTLDPQQTGRLFDDALALFDLRARQANSQFSLATAPPEEQMAALHICQLLEGMPLGIELAASWVRLLSCQEISREIEKSLGFLQSRTHDRPTRHQSLDAAFEHSWVLLPAGQQQALMRLTVFDNDFHHSAANTIAQAGLPQLAALVDCSLVQQTTSGRYRLQEILRQFAREKLHAAGLAGQIATRHASYYLAFLQQLTGDLRGSQQSVALQTVRQEIDNVRQAWRWAAQTRDAAGIGQALDSLFQFYDMRSWFQEGAEMFALAADAMQVTDPLVYARLLARLGWFTFHTGHQTGGQAMLANSVAHLRQQDAPTDLVFALSYLAAVHHHLGDHDQAQALAKEALALSQATQNLPGAAIADNILGQIAYRQGRLDDAQRYGTTSLALERQTGSRWSMAFSLVNLGKVMFTQGHYDQARRHFEESLAIRQSMQDIRGMAICRKHLGDTALALGQLAAAETHYQESLTLSRRAGDQLSVADALSNLGYVALAANNTPAGRSYHQQALRTILEMAAIPQTLAVLVGAATYLVHTAADLSLAQTIALAVWQHPAGTQTSKRRAAQLYSQLTGQDPAGAPTLPPAPLIDLVHTTLIRLAPDGATAGSLPAPTPPFI